MKISVFDRPASFGDLCTSDAGRRMLEIRQENVYCVGDHANDIPMLTFARTAFAPANAIQPVHEVPGIHILPNCWENAIAAMIAELDKRY